MFYEESSVLILGVLVDLAVEGNAFGFLLKFSVAKYLDKVYGISLPVSRSSDWSKGFCSNLVML